MTEAAREGGRRDTSFLHFQEHRNTQETKLDTQLRLSIRFPVFVHISEQLESGDPQGKFRILPCELRPVF